jgi:hypothetical protein
MFNSSPYFLACRKLTFNKERSGATDHQQVGNAIVFSLFGNCFNVKDEILLLEFFEEAVQVQLEHFPPNQAK